MRCDQCDMISINGRACHETGCPNSKSRYDAESGKWIKQRVCFDCGYTVDADDVCCSSEDDNDESGDDETSFADILSAVVGPMEATQDEECE